MTVKLVEELWCDRCGQQYEKRSPDGGYSPHYTLAVGWMKLNNGSGSKFSTPNRNDLDQDFCPGCTSSFFEWLSEGSNG